uniref:Uncharacterized protein n=1 Tax=Globodera rostochiensis TaxID=31243 RepID=A0A914IFY9_GLORO
MLPIRHLQTILLNPPLIKRSTVGSDHYLYWREIFGEGLGRSSLFGGLDHLFGDRPSARPELRKGGSGLTELRGLGWRLFASLVSRDRTS